jgi:vacuolar-type H+-ATPase subunit C/Vma6
LHPLLEGESIANLAYNNLVLSDDDVIQTLIDKFRNVQNILTMLNMKGSPTTQGHDSSWFNEPWKVEQDDLKHVAYVPFLKATTSEDGDCEVLRDCVDEEP